MLVVNNPKTLLIGYGNSARCDDGLGPAFVERITARNLQGLQLETEFQLAVEHSAQIAEYDVVIFADATVDSTKPFHFAELKDCKPQSMGSHSVTPEAAVALAELLFNATPRAFVLGISGNHFGSIDEQLSDIAQKNLDLAEQFFIDWYAGIQCH